MKKKHLVLTAATLSLAIVLDACGSYTDAATGLTARSTTKANAEHGEGTMENTANATVISANGSVITVTGNGTVAADGTVTIQRAGAYVLRGNFAEGQLMTDAEGGAEIKLVFDGFTISNPANAPLIFESGTSVTIVLQDGTENAVSDLRSSSEDNEAAIYAKSDLTISRNGTLAVQGNAEDTIHSEVNITMEDGALTLEAGDDGIHADETLTVRNDDTSVMESEEGLEGLVVGIQGGVITVTARDGDINASDGAGSDAALGQAAEDATVRVSGDIVAIKAGGDSIDPNGDLIISGGTVVVGGPSDSGNAPPDYDGKGMTTGGTAFVTGDSGMFQTLNDSGLTQKSLVVSLDSTQGTGTKMKIVDLKDNVVYENVTTMQTFNTLLLSAADLKQDENYIVTVGSEGRTVTVSDSANINSENGGNHGAPDSKPEERPNGQRPEDRSENNGRQDNRQSSRGERNGRSNGRGRQNDDALGEDRDGEVRGDRGVEQRGGGQHPEGRSENNGQQGGKDQNGKRPEGRSENGVRQGGRSQNGSRPGGKSENDVQQGGRSQNDNRPEGRPKNGVRQGGRGQGDNRPESGLENSGRRSDRNQDEKHPGGKPENSDRQGGRGQNGERPEGRPEDGGQQDSRGQNDKRPEGGSENGSRQGDRDRNSKRPEDKPKNGNQQGGRGQNGKCPKGKPENGGQQDGRGQNGKHSEGGPENDGQQGKQHGKRSVDDNDKSKGACSCSADCSCRTEREKPHGQG